MVSSNSAYEAAQVARLQAVELVDDWVSPDYVEEGEEEEEAASRMEGGMGELAGDEMPMDYAYSQLPTVSEEEEEAALRVCSRGNPPATNYWALASLRGTNLRREPPEAAESLLESRAATDPRHPTRASACQLAEAAEGPQGRMLACCAPRPGGHPKKRRMYDHVSRCDMYDVRR